MKLNETPRLPLDPKSVDFNGALTKILRETAQKMNQVSSGVYAGFDGQLTAPPTTGTWAQGDWVRNSNPVEAGTVLSRYVVHGWICTVGGTPGTWLQDRRLTGN